MRTDDKIFIRIKRDTKSIKSISLFIEAVKVVTLNEQIISNIIQL